MVVAEFNDERELIVLRNDDPRLQLSFEEAQIIDDKLTTDSIVNGSDTILLIEIDGQIRFVLAKTHDIHGFCCEVKLVSPQQEVFCRDTVEYVFAQSLRSLHQFALNHVLLHYHGRRLIAN